MSGQPLSDDVCGKEKVMLSPFLKYTGFEKWQSVFPLLVGDVDLVISGGAADVAFACFGIQYIARSAAAQEGDIGRKREGQCSVGVGCCCQCQVGKGEDGTPLRTASRIEMLCRDNQACLAVSFPLFLISSTPAFVAKRSFLKNSCAVMGSND